MHLHISSQQAVSSNDCTLIKLSLGPPALPCTPSRLLHPTDWLGEFWLAPLHWWAWLYTRVLVSTFWFIYSLIWRPQPSTQRG